MAIFNNMVLTDKGQILYAKAQAGKELKFTKMMVGSGKITTQDPSSLTALLEAKYDVGIQSITPNTAQKNAAISGYINNANMTEAVYICEIGLFAQDPDDGEILYAYGTAGQNGEFGDYMAPASSGPYAWNYVINAAVGNAANVTVVLSNLFYDYLIMNSNTTFIYLSGANQKDINTSIDLQLKKLHDSIDNIVLASDTTDGLMHKEDFTKLKNIDKTISGTLNTIEKNNIVTAINQILQIANSAADSAQSAFQGASDGKTSIANAITGKGGIADSSMTFSQLASAILAIAGYKYSNLSSLSFSISKAMNNAGTITAGTYSIDLGFQPDVALFWTQHDGAATISGYFMYVVPGETTHATNSDLQMQVTSNGVSFSNWNETTNLNVSNGCLIAFKINS